MAMLYFNSNASGGAGDGDWSNALNWWSNSSWTIHAGRTPVATDDVEIDSNVILDTNQLALTPGVNNCTFRNDSQFDPIAHALEITVQQYCQFYGNSYNNGYVNGSTAFHDNAINYGNITGTCTFNDYSSNQSSGTVYGNANFYDNSYNSSYVTGNAMFRQNAYNASGQGLVFGNATLDSNESAALSLTPVNGFVVSGSITFDIVPTKSSINISRLINLPFPVTI